MTLTEFLEARLDEDEAMAGAGARRVGMPWRAEPQPGTPGGLVIDDLGLVGSTGGRYAAEHIARHDPARALTEVAAKRKLLGGFLDLAEDMEARIEGEWGRGYETTGETAALLRGILAAVYSGHPDYDPAWAIPAGPC